MRFINQFHQIVRILQSYTFEEPFHLYLGKVFRENRQMGSRDRKLVGNACYNFFRTGKICPEFPVEKRILLGHFLVENSLDPFWMFHFQNHPEFSGPGIAMIERPLKEKTEWAASRFSGFSVHDIFPLNKHLSPEIDRDEFLLSHFSQPLLWVRVRKSLTGQFEQMLNKNGVPFSKNELVPSAFGLPPKSDLEKLFPGGKGSVYEVQDISSQTAGRNFDPSMNESWWDACAASGGKSLLLTDREPGIKLFVSDIRESILTNLSTRFSRAGVKDFYTGRMNLENPPGDLLSFQSSLSGKKLQVGKEYFDAIILDVPCSGSGTWGRTPEMLTGFSENEIGEYSAKQQEIVRNVLPFLKPGGRLNYLTCSVFEEENGKIARFIESNPDFGMLGSELVKGYRFGGDCMFHARFVKKGKK